VHLQKIGYPIANDQIYGGNVLNDGLDRFDEKLFSNSYENSEQAGKKMFLILWLHAYRYTYKETKVKT
jgi:23S rRNA-/tRNA-specific pseudouridylate synthase